MGNGIVISGTQSGSGKTTVNALVLSALRARGTRVQAFKTGPDYIDTAFSSHFSGKPAYNLDAWMMGDAGMLELAERKTEKALGVVEGVMGLIDGIRPESSAGSTLALANVLDWPVLLVVPAAKQGRSLRAALAGFLIEAGPGRVQGIVLNQVSGDRHADYIKRCLADFPVPVLGALPVCDELNWPERHLGLRASQEFSVADWQEVAELAERFLDVDRIVEIALGTVENGTMSLKTDYERWLESLSIGRSVLAREGKPDDSESANRAQAHSCQKLGIGKRIGIARDEAFHFYYQENLEALEDWGFELVPFSPLHDSALPDGLDGIVLGGGFPEVYAKELSENASMRESVKRFVDTGGACYAECGGFMYLCESLKLCDGSEYDMVGLVPGTAEMMDQLNHFGYSECIEYGNTEGYRAHEFHYSRWNLEEERANLWKVKKANRQTERAEGFGKGKLHASYLHLYFPQAEPLFRKLFATQPKELEETK